MDFRDLIIGTKSRIKKIQDLMYLAIIDYVVKEIDVKNDKVVFSQSNIAAINRIDKATDKQKLYNLKYEIEKADVFTDEHVTYFIELFVRKKVKSEVLSPFFKVIVDEKYIPLEAEEKDKFRKNINKYVRHYLVEKMLGIF